MKRLITIVPLLLILGILFAMPATVMAQTPPPDAQTFSGDQLVLGNNYTLQNNQVLKGTLVVLGGNADVQSGAWIDGDVAIVGGNLNLAGTVHGTISTIGGNISLNPGATITGDIVTFGGNISGQDEATIEGSIRTMSRSALLFDFGNVTKLTNPGVTALRSFGNVVSHGLLNILKVLGLALLALVVMLIVPKPIKNISQTITNQPLLSGGVGLLTVIVFPIVLVILTITIILIPVTLLGAIVLAVAGLLGWIAVGTFLGQRLEVVFKAQWADAVSTGIGTLVIGLAVWLLGYIFCLGAILVILILSLGLGGVVLSRFGTVVYAQANPSGGYRPAAVATVPPVTPPPAPPAAVEQVEAMPEEPEQPEAGAENPEKTEQS